MRSRLWIALVLTASLAVAACGDDDDATGDDGAAPADRPAEADETGDPSGDRSGGGGAGTLVLGDETIELGPGLCYLEEQDDVTGGTIELTAQALGTNAAGEKVHIDFSRRSADSTSAGSDHIVVVIGDAGTGDEGWFSASLDIGAVQVDGTTLSATDFGVSTFPAGASEEIPASFQIEC